MEAQPIKGRLAPRPLFNDPIYQGAADPTLIWHSKQRKWYMFYTNRRANETHPSGVSWVHGTKIGIAVSLDGAHWDYLDTANINYRPRAQNTYWAPEIIHYKGLYHMFVTYVPGVFNDWEHPRNIIHLVSHDLINWQFKGTLKLSSDRVIDPCIYRKPDGSWRMWYNNETDHKSIYFADSNDLSHWTDKGKAINNMPGEGPVVFKWKHKYFMIVDNWKGMGVYSSADLLNWQRQDERILEKPGTGKDDASIGGHAGIILKNDHAYLFYFTHPGRSTAASAALNSEEWRRSVIQVVELKYNNGIITCNRDDSVYININ